MLRLDALGKFFAGDSSAESESSDVGGPSCPTPRRRTLSRGLDVEESPNALPSAISDSAGKITIAAISRIASELDLGE